MNRILSLITLMALLGLGNGFAQNASYNLSNGSQVTIEGTSNVHDWTVEVDRFQSSLTTDASGSNLSILNTTIDIKVDDMQSGRSRMDRLMHSSLKKDVHPAITFRLDPSQTTVNGSNGNLMVSATGLVTIAGVEQRISLDLEGKRNSSNDLHFTGSKNLKMSDYEVDPPTAMLGTVRAGDEITIRFDLLYSPVN